MCGTRFFYVRESEPESANKVLLYNEYFKPVKYQRAELRE